MILLDKTVTLNIFHFPVSLKLYKISSESQMQNTLKLRLYNFRFYRDQ